MSVIIKYANLNFGGIQSWLKAISKGFNDINISVEFKGKREGLFKSLFQVSDFVIHGTWKYAFFSLFRILLNRKVAILVHGNEIYNQSFLNNSLISFLCRFDNIYWVFNSNYTCSLFFEKWNVNNFIVENPIVEIPNSNCDFKKYDIFTFVTLTRLVKRKNINEVLFALRDIKSSGYSFQYFIMGDGNQKDNIENTIKELELTENVFLLGKVSDKEKNEVLSRSQLFLLPSIDIKEDSSVEGFGMVFIEANIMGIPVISGDSGGMPEAVEHGKTGFHCDGTRDSIKKYILKVIDGDIYFDNEYIKSYGRQHTKLSSQFIKIITGK